MSKRKFNLTSLLIVGAVMSFALCAVFLAKLAGFEFKLPEKKETAVDNSQLSTPEPVIDNTIKFDVEKAKVGDKLGGMVITKLRGYKSEQATGDSAFVDFTGKVTVRGDVIYNKPDSLTGELICMGNLDNESQAKMPKLTSQFYVDVGFCFNNLELAKKLLVKDLKEENQGVASVTIDNYKIQWFPIEIYNTADLVEVK